jgi:hypothetical protein
MMNRGRINSELARTVSFGPFHLIPAQRLLLEGEKPLRLGSRALEILTRWSNVMARPKRNSWLACGPMCSSSPAILLYTLLRSGDSWAMDLTTTAVPGRQGSTADIRPLLHGS